MTAYNYIGATDNSFSPIQMQFTKYLLLFIVLAAIPGICKSQADPSKFVITKLTPDNGLSQGSNYFRFEDSKGFMWITGNDAVNRYDGSAVKVYNLDKYFEECPNLQQGYGFTEDDNANIYIGSGKGLYCYSRNTEKFTLQKVFTNAPDDVAMPFAFENNKVWCFNRFYQLATYNVKTKEVKAEAAIDLDTLNSIHIYQNINNVFYYRFPTMDKEGNIWMVGKYKVAVYNILNKTTSFPVAVSNTNVNKEFLSSCYDTARRILTIGTNNGILQYYKHANKIVFCLRVGNKLLGKIFTIAVNKNIIAINSSAGLFFTTNDFKKTHWLEESEQKKNITYFQFSFDRSGRCWITEDGKGQMIFNFKPKLFYKIPEDNTTLPFLKNRVVANIAELPDHNILFHSQWVLNKKDNTCYKFTIKNSENIFYRSITDTLRKGNWFFSEGIMTNTGIETGILFRNAAGVFKSCTAIEQYNKLGQQQDLVVLPNGVLLVSFSTGLYKLNEKNHILETLNENTAAFKINILSGNSIAVSYLNKDMVLYRLDANNNITTLQHILPGVQSFYIQENSKTNQYWVGTNKGIYLLDRDFKTLQHFDANNGLAGTNIYGLLLDDAGNAWCSHQKGLSSINAENYAIINYDKSDGIQDWDFNNRSFFKAADGTLYFGGINGANYFKPPLQSNAYYKSEVYIDEILVNNNSFLPDTNASQIKRISLDYKENNISLKAFIKNLENASYQEIIFRIKEQGNKWNYLGNKGNINFTSLAPGNYTLELGIFDKFSNQNIVQKTISIHISKPFYFTALFWFFLTGLAVVLFLFRRSIRKLNRQRIIFQQQLALQQQRNKITADLHDDIGASLSSLQVNSAVANQLLGKDMAKTREVLNKIETQAQNIADKIGDIIWSMKPGKDEFMTLSTRIRNFANDIMGATNINYQIQIDTAVDSKVKDITARKNLVLIAKEAVNNAVKYSHAKNLTITLQLNADKIVLTVTDDGIGFNNTVANGNGLANMRKRVEELNGVFSVVSSSEKGTAISAIVPLVP